MKRKLESEKEKLSKELKEFELRREEETKKIQEEKRKLKRDKLLLDKATRESKFSTRGFGCLNCEENKSKAQRLMEDFKKKEMKWNAAINKLEESLLQVEREKAELKSENIQLRHRASDDSDDDDDDDCAPDSGFRSQQIRYRLNSL